MLGIESRTLCILNILSTGIQHQPHCLILRPLKVVYYIYFAGDHMSWCECGGRGQLAGVGSLFLPCSSQGSDSDLQACALPCWAISCPIFSLFLRVNYISCIPPFLYFFPWAERKKMHRIIEYLCVLSSEICIVFLVPPLNLQLWQHTICDVFWLFTEPDSAGSHT